MDDRVLLEECLTTAHNLMNQAYGYDEQTTLAAVVAATIISVMKEEKKNEAV